MMMGSSPSIIWPAPGYPALVEEGREALAILVTCRKGGEAVVRDWLKGICLRSSHGDGEIPLGFLKLTPVTPDERSDQIGGFASLPEAKEFSFFECHYEVPIGIRPEPPTRSEVWDLWAGDRCLRKRCVALTRFSDHRLSIAFATDLHLSALWDSILDEIGQHAPDLRSRVVSPTEQWERFVAAANQQWRRGELDLVVLGGDLVDHVRIAEWSVDDSAIDGETNVHRFLDALQPLLPPVFVIPGNHDHRLFPWRPRTYGLEAIGLSKNDTRELLSILPWGKERRFRLSDRHSIETHDKHGRSALSWHWQLLSPSADFAIDAAGMRLIFASTGPDALAHARDLARHHPIRFLQSMASVWRTPDSLGFDERQIQRIGNAMSDTSGAAVFFHAPLLNPTGWRIDTELPRPEKRAWQRAELRRGVSFSQSQELLERLITASIPVTTFSGHIHQTSRIDVHPIDRRMRVSDIAAAIDPRMPVHLLTGPALGQAGPGGKIATGWLSATFESGCLDRLEHNEI